MIMKSAANPARTLIPAAVFFLACFFCLSVPVSAGSADGCPVKPGIEVLRDRGFEGLVGKRVGLVTNPSGVDRNLRSTIDILYNAPGVELVALYTRKPTPEMLRGIDVMVYDIQDTGARSYTFISTMGLVMDACGELGIEVMVLDRPNPLGGLKVEGSVVEPGFFSFVSQYRIPYIYGLTPGELAMLINAEGLNRGQTGKQEPARCSLTVIPMEGWHRDMLYQDTGLPWVLPSPNIPYQTSPVHYCAAGICGELYGFLNIGIGYTLPFQVFAEEWIDAQRLKAELDSYDIPGVEFRTIYFKPLSGRTAGKLVQGVQYFFTDYEAAPVTLVQFYVMQAVAALYPDKKPFETATGVGLFDKVCGSDYIRKTFGQRYLVSDIIGWWQKDAAAFRDLSSAYYLYR